MWMTFRHDVPAHPRLFQQNEGEFSADIFPCPISARVTFGTVTLNGRLKVQAGQFLANLLYVLPVNRAVLASPEIEYTLNFCRNSLVLLFCTVSQ